MVSLFLGCSIQTPIDGDDKEKVKNFTANHIRLLERIAVAIEGKKCELTP